MGPATNCGKKTDKRGKSYEIGGGFEFFAVHINCIAEGLKGIKTDPNRKDQVKPARAYFFIKKGECRGKTFNEEIIVLKKSQKPNINHNTGKKQ